MKALKIEAGPVELQSSSHIVTLTLMSNMTISENKYELKGRKLVSQKSTPVKLGKKPANVDLGRALIGSKIAVFSKLGYV